MEVILKNNILLPNLKKLVFTFLAFLLIFTFANKSFSFQKNNINTVKIKVDLSGRVISIGSGVWHFEKKEPIYIDIIDSKYKKDNAVVYIFLRTISQKSKTGIEGKLRLAYEYAADEWNLLELKPISVDKMKKRKVNRLLELVDYPLHFASYIGDLKKVKELLKSGISVNSVEGKRNSTALGLASSMGHIDIAKFLISSGADVNQGTKFKRTPLFTAIVNGSPELVNCLIKSEANINMQDQAGLTPLHYAVYKNNIELVKILLNAGADTTIRSIRKPKSSLLNQSMTALDLAKKMDEQGIVNLLREGGAAEGIIYEMFTKGEIIPGKSIAGICIGDDINAIKNKIEIEPGDSGEYLSFDEDFATFRYTLIITVKNNKVDGISSQINFYPNNLNLPIKLPKIGNREFFIENNNILSLNKTIKKLIPNYIGDFDFISDGEKVFRTSRYNGFEFIYWPRSRVVIFSVPDGTLDDYLQVKTGKFVPIQ